MEDETRAAWQALLPLLGPVHDDALRFARRIARSNSDGDDVFQDAVLRAATKLPSLREPARFRSWFFQVIVSVHRSRCRQSFWRRIRSDESPGVAKAVADRVGENGAHLADQRAGAARAARALAALPPAQREAVVLFELEGYSVEEIGEIQQSSISSVKSRLSRGRDRLREFYAELDEPVARRSAQPAANHGGA